MKTKKGLKMATKKKPKLDKHLRWGKIIIDILRDADRPLRVATIMEDLKVNGYRVDSMKINNVIFYAKNKGYIVAYKKPGVPSYYCLPHWFNKKGKLKKQITEIA